MRNLLPLVARLSYNPEDPGLPPPDGVESNFDNPSNRNYMVAWIDFVCLALVVVFVTLRFYSRLIQQRKMNEVDSKTDSNSKLFYIIYTFDVG